MMDCFLFWDVCGLLDLSVNRQRMKICQTSCFWKENGIRFALLIALLFLRWVLDELRVIGTKLASSKSSVSRNLQKTQDQTSSSLSRQEQWQEMEICLNKPQQLAWVWNQWNHLCLLLSEILPIFIMEPAVLVFLMLQQNSNPAGAQNIASKTGPVCWPCCFPQRRVIETSPCYQLFLDIGKQFFKLCIKLAWLAG